MLHVRTIDLTVSGAVYDYNPGRLIVIRGNVATSVGVDLAAVSVTVTAGSVTLEISIVAQTAVEGNAVGETLRLRFASPAAAAAVFGGSVDVLSVSPVRASTTPSIVWSVPTTPPAAPPPPPASPPLTPSPPSSPPSLPPPVVPLSTATVAAIVFGSLAALLLFVLCLGVFARTVRSGDGTVAPYEGVLSDAFAAAATARAARGGISERQVEMGTVKAKDGLAARRSRIDGGTDLYLNREEMGRYLRDDWRQMYHGR